MKGSKLSSPGAFDTQDDERVNIEQHNHPIARRLSNNNDCPVLFTFK